MRVTIMVLAGAFLVGFGMSAQAQRTQVVTLVAAGDVEWSGTNLGSSGSIVMDNEGRTLLEGGWQPIPRFLSNERMAELAAAGSPLVTRITKEREEAYGASREHLSTTYAQLKAHDLDFASTEEWARFPFQKIAPVFRAADIAFVNLESPLSDRAHRTGIFRTPTAFADGLQFAGIDVVSTANNHALDTGRQGLFDTKAALIQAGMAPFGSGENLEDARRPAVVERNGVTFAFLAYAQYENSGTIGFATPDRAGVVPLDPDIIKEDIARVRSEVDHVILSFHWDIYHFDVSRSHELHPRAVEFAHEMIDAGADAILGHHPHVPRAVEVYRGRPIFYSMGHLIFSFGLPQWGDNYLARVQFSKQRVERVEVLPVAGRWDDLAQPYLVEGGRARALLNKLQALSGHLGTSIRIDGDVGILEIDRSAASGEPSANIRPSPNIRP